MYHAVIGLMLALSIGMRPAELSGEDWTHWRGARRSDVVIDESGWQLGKWIDERPLWTTQVGEGASSPLRVGQAIYLFGHRDQEDRVVCLDAANGKPVWSSSYPARRYGRNATGDEGLYSGPSSTPEFHDQTGYLYTLGPDGDLHAWDTARRGARVWHANLYDRYAMPQRARVGRSGRRDYGYTSSPLVHQDWLLVEAGGPQGTIVAFDKRSGEEAWRSEAHDVAGHTGGMAPIDVEGLPCIAVMTFAGLLVVRLDEPRAGETVATFPWVTDFANNIASPAVSGDCVLITSEYNHRAICKLRVTRKGIEKLWEQPFPSKACTPVIHDDRIYVAWERLRCLDWQTGSLVWEGPRVGDAGSCLVTSDEKLIVWCNQGELFLVDAAFVTERRQFQTPQGVWPCTPIQRPQ